LRTVTGRTVVVLVGVRVPGRLVSPPLGLAVGLVVGLALVMEDGLVVW